MFLNVEKIRERSPLLSKNDHQLSHFHNNFNAICSESDVDVKFFNNQENEVMSNRNNIHILTESNTSVSNKKCDLLCHNVLLSNTENVDQKRIQFVNTNITNGIVERSSIHFLSENSLNSNNSGLYCECCITDKRKINCGRQLTVDKIQLQISEGLNNLNHNDECNYNDDNGNHGKCTENTDIVNKDAESKETTVQGENGYVGIRKRSNVAKCGKKTTFIHSGLRLSLFPDVPPYISFNAHDKKGAAFPTLVQKQLRWKMSTITPAVVKQVVTNSGFRLFKKSTEWGGTWGKHLKSICFKTIHEHQKMNHFPGTFQLGRKDRLWKNIHKFMLKFGCEEYGFMPATYILPFDTKALRSVWEDKETEKWIVKPPASARGVGIKVIHKWCQIPRKVTTIVQKYVSDPYLINGTKFDLRLYVLVTSFNPLRLYLYENGLVRFASVKYSTELNTLNDQYMHLTNYSINKLSTQYMHNENVDACHGHKWTIKTLWNYLEKEFGADINDLWRRLTDLVVKTILSAESPINKLIDANRISRYNCYELFGVDVLFDKDLKPWLLEVNISPSLHSSSPLDLAVKGPLVRDLFNIAGFQIPASKKCTEAQLKRGLGKVQLPVCYDRKLYIPVISPPEQEKHDYFEQATSREEYLNDILKELTADDVRHLIQYEDELTQVGLFHRIFPTRDTHNYFKFFDEPKYYNYLLDAWETRYHNCRRQGVELLRGMCSKGVHLDVSLVDDNTASDNNNDGHCSTVDCSM